MSKISYKIDKFTDFSGKSREVIFCAVSVDEFSEYKSLRVGVSVQNVKDEINTELGKKIAFGKAMKDKSCCGILASSNKGMINAKVVEALLEQEMDYFKLNPGKYLAGYNKDRDLFKKDSVLYYQRKGIIDDSPF